MKFKNNTLQSKIDEAIILATQYFHPYSDMMTAIKNKSDWKYNSGSGQDIYLKIYNYEKEINVYTYKPWNPFTSAIGYSDGKAVYVNIRKLPSMTVKDIAANFCHEATHMVGYSHGNNYKTDDKVKFSAPYFISEWIEKNA